MPPLDPDPISDNDPDVRLAVALERMAIATRDTASRVEALHGLLGPVATAQVQWNAARVTFLEAAAGFVGIPRLVLGQNRPAQIMVVGVLAVMALAWVGVDSELATRAVLDKLGLYIPPPPVECTPVTVETTAAPVKVLPLPVPVIEAPAPEPVVP